MKEMIKFRGRKEMATSSFIIRLQLVERDLLLLLTTIPFFGGFVFSNITTTFILLLVYLPYKNSV
jgi:hypothetical protein